MLTDILNFSGYYLQLDTLNQQDLASRLTLNCVSSYVEPQNVQVMSSDITLMNVSLLSTYALVVHTPHEVKLIVFSNSCLLVASDVFRDKFSRECIVIGLYCTSHFSSR